MVSFDFLDQVLLEGPVSLMLNFKAQTGWINDVTWAVTSFDLLNQS